MVRYRSEVNQGPVIHSSTHPLVLFPSHPLPIPPQPRFSFTNAIPIPYSFSTQPSPMFFPNYSSISLALSLTHPPPFPPFLLLPEPRREVEDDIRQPLLHHANVRGPDAAPTHPVVADEEDRRVVEGAHLRHILQQFEVRLISEAQQIEVVVG